MNEKIVHRLASRILKSRAIGFVAHIVYSLHLGHASIYITIPAAIRSNLSNRPTRTVTYLNSVVSTDKYNTKHVLISKLRAEAYLQMGDYNKASNELKWIVAATNSYPDVVKKLMKIYRLWGKEDAAIILYRWYLKSKPDDLGVMEEATKSYSNLGMWSEATGCWDKIIQVHGNSLDQQALLSASKAYRLANYPSKSLKLFDEIEIDSTKAAFEFFMSLVLSGRLERARQTIDLLNKRGKPTEDQLRQIRYQMSLIDRIENIDKYALSLHAHKKRRSTKRVVIYTAYSKGYDYVKLHKHYNPDYDYVVFTDDENFLDSKYNPYDFRALSTAEEHAPELAIRYYKTQPHKVFSEYEYAIWVDTSIMFTEDISPLVEDFINSGKEVGSTPHSARKNIIDEALACIERGKDKSDKILQQLEKYIDSGVSKNKLYENGFLMFDLKNPDTGTFLDIWWHEIQTQSKRDQLSFGYAVEKAGVDVHRNFPEGEDIHNNSSLVVSPHVNYEATHSKLVINLGEYK